MALVSNKPNIYSIDSFLVLTYHSLSPGFSSAFHTPHTHIITHHITHIIHSTHHHHSHHISHIIPHHTTPHIITHQLHHTSHHTHHTSHHITHHSPHITHIIHAPHITPHTKFWHQMSYLNIWVFLVCRDVVMTAQVDNDHMEVVKLLVEKGVSTHQRHWCADRLWSLIFCVCLCECVRVHVC